MRTRLLAAAAVFTATSLLAAPFAGGQVVEDDGEATVTANLTATGVRSITAVAPVVLAELDAPGVNAYEIVVTEVAKTGTNSWNVKAKMCGPADLATGLGGSDCDTRPNALYNTAGVPLPGANITASNRETTATVGIEGVQLSGTPTDPIAATADFSTDVEVYSVTDEVASQIYNGIYTSTGALALDLEDVTAATTYNGYFVVTLLN